MTLANEHSYFPTPFFLLLDPTITVLRPFSPCFATLWPRFGPISLLRLAPHLLVVCPAPRICLYVQSVCFLFFLRTIQRIKFFLTTTNLLIVEIIRTTRIMALTRSPREADLSSTRGTNLNAGCELKNTNLRKKYFAIIYIKHIDQTLLKNVIV